MMLATRKSYGHASLILQRQINKLPDKLSRSLSFLPFPVHVINGFPHYFS